jgi:hypothetical protein
MEKGIESDEYGGHKRTRFPCLATARYVAAAVVSVLTVAVVVMVIIVALRPEKVIFSIPQYIVADRLWWDDVPGVTASSEHAPIPSRVGGRATSAVNTNAGTVTSTKTAVPVIINDPDTSFPFGTTETTTTYSPVKNVSFLVSFTAYNPSGRADVSGKNVTIRVLDMPYYGSPNFSFQTIALTEIITYELEDHFSVNRQTTHTLRKWILVDNATVLSYLAGKYGGWPSFTAMVHVTVTSGMQGNSSQIYYCWPVIVDWSRGYDRSTSCRPEKEMDSNVSYSGPPPAPVPAPAPAPTR